MVEKLRGQEIVLPSAGRRWRGAIGNMLGRAILLGEYAPGDVLPGEIAFAEENGVSRGVYREAVQGLIAKGLVESRPGTGTRVLPRRRWNMLDADVLAWAFADKPDMALLRSLFELRSAVEPAAAAFAAERHDRGDLKALKGALARMRRHTLSTAARLIADHEFHDAILTASRNDALVTLSAGIMVTVTWSTHLKQRHRALPRNLIPEHVTVYNAIADRNSRDAAAAMHHLINLSMDSTRMALETMSNIEDRRDF